MVMRKHIVFIEGSITGASECAHRIAKEKGCFVSLFSRNQEVYSPLILANTDSVIACETNDAEALADQVQAYHEQFPVDALTSLADFYIPQAARAAEQLGLPTMSYQAAAGVRNKYRMRENLQATCPDLNPPFRRVQDLEQALAVARDWGLPLVAKPQDGNDSVNVRLIREVRELQDYMQQAASWSTNSAGQSIEKGVLLEGYIDGREYSVESAQGKGGELRLIGVVSKGNVGIERGFFPEIGAYFPLVSEEADLLSEAVLRALPKLGIDCGVIHTELRIQQGQPKIIEINPRLMGNKMGSHVIPLATHYAPAEAVVDAALGVRDVWPTGQRYHGSALWGAFADRAGNFQGVTNLDELKRMPGVVYIDVIPKVGTTIRLPETNEDILVWISTIAEDGETAQRLAEKACQAVQLDIRS